MTRDEWIVMPDGTRLHRSLDGRQYFERDDGTATVVMVPAVNNTKVVDLPLAEFEALLFGPDQSPGLKRAAEDLVSMSRHWNSNGVLDTVDVPRPYIRAIAQELKGLR